MPFPALTALGFTSSEDSQYFQDVPINGAMKYEVDGGLLITRRRFTRNAGLNIVTGFTDIPVSDKILLDQFIFSLGGGAAETTYVHPLTGVTWNIRFSEDPPYSCQYTGWGSDRVWTITDLKLRAE